MARLILRAATTLAFLLLVAAPVAAIQIDLSLNIHYADPSDSASGGTWEVVAKADEFGLDSLSFQLSGIDPVVQSGLPTGKVNGSADVNAGFKTFSTTNAGGAVSVVAAQTQTDPLSGEAGAFYGVGNFANGSPDYAGMPVGSMAIGPTFTTLADVTGVAWADGDAFGDAAWEAAATIATGTFQPAEIPAFTGILSQTFGTVYTSLGDSTTVGSISDFLSTTISLTVRDNFDPGLPDYNNDGVVDAADYAVWRNTLGDVVPPGSGADGDSSGVIDQPDYQLWRDNYGAVVPGSGSGSITAIPEPSSAVLATFFLIAAGRFHRQKQGFFGVMRDFSKNHEYKKKLLDTQELPSHNAAE